MRACLVSFLFLAVSALAFEGGKAILKPRKDRMPATALTAQDASGKVMSLQEYRGQILVLDFWATWCHGCKQEMPWFAEFHRKYSAKGLNVVGVSMDSDGWAVVRPFLKTADVPYRIVVGDDAVGKSYGISSMPDTFLIDRDGKIAAVYNGVVDKSDIEANIQKLLSKP